MTRTALPFFAPDLSALARALAKTLAEYAATHQRLPGHVEMMNLLARGVGQRNLQALQAATLRRPATAASAAADAATDAWFDAPVVAEPAADAAPPGVAAALSAHAVKALRHFDRAGRLERWPLKLCVQRLAMWVLWTRFDARRTYTEAQVNQVLKAWHLYGDHATLRRELINHRLFTRKSDCSEYRKCTVEPDDEVRALLRALRSPARQRPAPHPNRPPNAVAIHAAGAKARGNGVLLPDRHP